MCGEITMKSHEKPRNLLNRSVSESKALASLLQPVQALQGRILRNRFESLFRYETFNVNLLKIGWT
jgi:hypothetical protein